MDEIARLEPKQLFEHKQSDGSVIIDVSSLQSWATNLALPLGDAIHNLRAALDHTWNALARDAKIKGFPTFPFHERRQELIDSVGKSPVARAFPSVHRLIFDEIKPHRDEGGNEVFWTITKFDKIDKHNLLVPIVDVTKIEHLTIVAGGMRFEMSDCTGANFRHLARVHGPITYEGEPKISFEVAFPTDSYLPGQSISETLTEMVRSTRHAISLFKSEFET